MNPRYEIRGSMRRAKLALLGARQALLNGLDDEECMLTPPDMRTLRQEIKEMAVLLSDVRKATAKFGEVADARSALV
jgi:hypothetical protein